MNRGDWLRCWKRRENNPTNNQNYIYMIYTCRTILTGNWQKDSCTTKAVRIMRAHTHTHTHTQIRQEEKWPSQDLCFWEGIQRKWKITWVYTGPGEWVVWATDRVSYGLGPTKERQAPSAGWRTATMLEAARLPPTALSSTPAQVKRTVQPHLCHITSQH